jgi:hypothetical protein
MSFTVRSDHFERLYGVDQNESVRKAKVDNDVAESRLHGLKHRLTASKDKETEDLRQEIEHLGQRIDDRTGRERHG